METETKPAGVGRLPTENCPDHLLLYHKPLHTQGEWERAGRPFWLIQWFMPDDPANPDSPGETMYARTHVPTHTALAIPGLPPPFAGRVHCGVILEAGANFLPCCWTGYPTFEAANRAAVARNGCRRDFVTWDRKLAFDTAQSFAPADPPALPGVHPPAETPDPKKPPLMRKPPGKKKK